MGIEFRFDERKKILLSKVEGAVTYEEFYKHLMDERKATGLTYPEIMDARTATPDLTSGEIRSLIYLLRGLGHVYKLGPTAFVISSQLAFGLVRMAAILAEDVCPIAPFWTTEEAEAWIASVTGRELG